MPFHNGRMVPYGMYPETDAAERKATAEPHAVAETRNVMEDNRTGAEAEADFGERINGPTPEPLAIKGLAGWLPKGDAFGVDRNVAPPALSSAGAQHLVAELDRAMREMRQADAADIRYLIAKDRAKQLAERRIRLGNGSTPEGIFRNREGILWEFVGMPSPGNPGAWQCWMVQGEAPREGVYWPKHFRDGTLTFVSDRETPGMDPSFVTVRFDRPVTDATEGGPGICGDTCRLGATCRVCKPPKAAPWVPLVDDFDLLPDA